MITDIQLAVKFQKNGSYATFESSRKKSVDWDSITDSEYVWMMKEAISTIQGMLENYESKKPLT